MIKESEIETVCKLIENGCLHSNFAEFYPPQPQWFSVSYDEIKYKAEYGHFYLAKEDDEIVGCGCIAPYYDSLTESWITSICVAPEHQRKGIGRRIIEFLEQDEYAKRANRIEIHSAISAIPFYRKLGYEHKCGQLTYHNGHFDLEKFLSPNDSKI